MFLRCFFSLALLLKEKLHGRVNQAYNSEVLVTGNGKIGLYFSVGFQLSRAVSSSIVCVVAAIPTLGRWGLMNQEFTLGYMEVEPRVLKTQAQKPTKC